MPSYTISVVFPKPNGRGEVTEPHVLQSCIVCKENERINWDLVSVDSRIKYAEVVFDDAKHKFFPNSNKYGSLLKNGKAYIYSDVPDFKKRQPFSAKYRVCGFDRKGGKLLSEVDPEIIVDEP